jgi:hypothetical protein
MKLRLIIFIITLQQFNSYGQPDTIYRHRKVPNEPAVEEQFYVLKSDKKVKHGPYTKYMVGMNRYSIFETGRYIDNRKVGQWDFFYKSTYDQISAKGHFINDMKNGTWAYYFYDGNLDSIKKTNSVRYSQEKTTQNEYTISINAKSAVKSSGSYLNDQKIGAWNYFDRKGGLVLTIDHSKDSVTFLDPHKMPEEAIDGDSFKPFFIGGKEYLELMMKRNPINEINKTGVLIYTLKVDPDGVNSLTLKENTTSSGTEKGFRKNLSEFLNDWIPKIEGGKFVPSEIQLEFTVTSERFDAHTIIHASPYSGFNSTASYFRYTLEIR